MILLDAEELPHPADGAVVVGAEVVVDKHQHLLSRKHRVIAAQVLDIAHVAGIEQQLWAVGTARDLLAFPSCPLELDRPSEVLC